MLQVKALEMVNADNVSLETSNRTLEQQLSSSASPQVCHTLFCLMTPLDTLPRDKLVDDLQMDIQRITLSSFWSCC